MSKPISAPTFSLNVKIWLSFLVLTLTWGSSFILVKRSLQAYSPWQVASIRLASAFVVLGFWAGRSLREIPVSKLPYVALSGLLSMFIPAYLFCAAQLGVSSSVAGVLNALTPAFTFIVGITFFQQYAKRMQVVGLLMGFIGSALLILVNTKGEFSLNSYGFFIVAATVCYGFNVNMVKKHLQDVKAIHLTSLAVGLAGILGLIMMLSTDWLRIYQEHPTGKLSFWSAVTLGVMGTAFAQLMFNWMLRHSTAVFASSITYFIPIVAVLWGVWDGEILLFWHFIGMAGIIGGILVLNRFR